MRLTNFINGLSFGVDCSKSARNDEPSSRGAFNGGLASVDSGLKLNLEIALSGVSAKVKPPTDFSVRRKCVETSDNVIEDDFISTPDSRIWDFSPIRLGAAKTAREIGEIAVTALHDAHPEANKQLVNLNLSEATTL